MESVLCTLLESFRDYDEDMDELYDRLMDLSDDIEFAERCQDWEDLETLQSQYDDIKAQYDALESKRTKEYQEEIKQLPGPTNKTEFEGFRIDETDPPYWGYMIPGQPDRDYYLKKGKYIDSYIAEMTPEQYLLLCGKYAWKARYNNVQDIYDRLSKQSHELIHQYAEQMKQGDKAPLPHLDIKNAGQEGRHRAFAAMELGITSIPVLIII